MKNDDSVAPEVVNRYLNLLRRGKEDYRDFAARLDAGKQAELLFYVDVLQRKWMATIKFLAAELGIESRADVPLAALLCQGSVDTFMRGPSEMDEKQDDVITCVYDSVVVALGSKGFDVDDDYLQEHVERFTDRVWGWLEDGGVRMPEAF